MAVNQYNKKCMVLVTKQLTLSDVKTLLETEPIERTPYGLYFIDLNQTEQYRDESLQVNRIHFWDPSIPTFSDGDWAGVHSHPQGYTARTLLGKMRYTFWNFTPQALGNWANTRVERFRGERTRIGNRTGESHSVEPGTCHKVHPVEFSITYFTEPKYQDGDEIVAYKNLKANPTKMLGQSQLPSTQEMRNTVLNYLHHV